MLGIICVHSKWELVQRKCWTRLPHVSTGTALTFEGASVAPLFRARLCNNLEAW